MCIGIPCQIVSIDNHAPNIAIAEVNGIGRQIDISLVANSNNPITVGQWVLVHVGFAMSILDEDEAKHTLSILNAMQEEEPDVSVLFIGKE
ncbi:HypC/HybG/HupF family hydrogenase formation chaperone [Orbus sturtevantii]|uniref:HypC/HybG/HupF family hydrogenase formation chaperone n=1 Tax=Orbus sturtevantii TaxID=3074109 RepID=UPI00370D0738